MYKAKNSICPKYIADLFQRTDTKYPLRDEEFVIPIVDLIRWEAFYLITGRYIGPELWNLLPKKIRDLPTLSVFKQHILQLDILHVNCLLTDTHCSNCTLCSA